MTDPIVGGAAAGGVIAVALAAFRIIEKLVDKRNGNGNGARASHKCPGLDPHFASVMDHLDTVLCDTDEGGTPKFMCKANKAAESVAALKPSLDKIEHLMQKMVGLQRQLLDRRGP